MGWGEGRREGTREMGIWKYIVVLGAYYLKTRTTNRRRTSLGLAPVPHHRLNPSKLLPRATVPRHHADILAESPLASSQPYLHRGGKVDDRPDQ